MAEVKQEAWLVMREGYSPEFFSHWGDADDRADFLRSQYQGTDVRIVEYVPASSLPAVESMGAWVTLPGQLPEVDSFAWIIWEGVIQDQPWQWVNTNDGETMFHFEGHELGLDEVDAYLLIAKPTPPALPAADSSLPKMPEGTT